MARTKSGGAKKRNNTKETLPPQRIGGKKEDTFVLGINDEHENQSPELPPTASETWTIKSATPSECAEPSNAISASDDKYDSDENLDALQSHLQQKEQERPSQEIHGRDQADVLNPAPEQIEEMRRVVESSPQNQQARDGTARREKGVMESQKRESRAKEEERSEKHWDFLVSGAKVRQEAEEEEQRLHARIHGRTLGKRGRDNDHEERRREPRPTPPQTPTESEVLYYNLRKEEQAVLWSEIQKKQPDMMTLTLRLNPLSEDQVRMVVELVRKRTRDYYTKQGKAIPKWARSNHDLWEVSSRRGL